MRIRFKKSDLLPAAGIVQSVANPQSTLPILSNVLVSTEHDNMATLYATDYETRARIQVPAEVQKKGQVTIPAKTFYDLIKEMPEEADVILESKDKGATITCRDIVADLQTMPARDFPKWPEFEPEHQFELPQGDLKRLLEKILFAVPVRDPRKVLLGALFEFKEGRLNAVATDGKILAYYGLPMTPDFTGPMDRNLVIPHKMLDELGRNLRDEGVVEIAFDERQVGFRLGHNQFVSNQIEGRYPNYEAVVPKEFGRSLGFPKPPMSRAVRRASILSDIKNNAISMDFRGDTVVVEAESYDKGRLREELPAKADGGADFKIVFNYKFVNDVLKALDRDEIELRVNQPTTPAVFRSVGIEIENYYLVMPIKLAEIKEYDDQPMADGDGAADRDPGEDDDSGDGED